MVATKFGTPYTNSAVRVLLLGGGELGKELAIAFQRLGVEVHVADKYADSPAMQVAHKSYVLNMADANELLPLIESIGPDYIVPEVEAIATEVLREVENNGISRVIPNAFAVQATMDRQMIRSLAAEEVGVATSPYAFASSLDELRINAAQIGFPCFVKPTMSSSGHGQTLVKAPEELAAAWTYAQDDARATTGRVIVEGMVDFDFEITLLTVRAIDAETKEVKTTFCDPIGHRQIEGDYVESWQPLILSEKALELAQDTARRVTTALAEHGEPCLGLFGVELFICGDQVVFSELSPRPHDTGMVTLVTQRLSEFDLHARAILGLPVDTKLKNFGASAVIKSTSSSTQPSYHGVFSALAGPETDVRIFAKPESHPGRRMGVALAVGSDIAQARERAQNAAEQITVEG